MVTSTITKKPELKQFSDFVKSRLDQTPVIVNNTDISSLQKKVKLQHNIYLSLLQKKSIY